VCLDIADVVRDELTILPKKVEELRIVSAFCAFCQRSVLDFARSPTATKNDSDTVAMRRGLS